MSSGHWWRSAVFYQIYVRSFADADGNGLGDLPGIRSRLPYLRDLGVDCIWLTPFYPSPGADHGYDVSDYVDVDPQFGTLDDFDALVAEAHRARPPRHRRHRPEPHVRRASVVPERDRGSEPSRPRAIHLPARARRRAAERLDLRLRRACLDARRGQRRVVPPPLRARAARPGLAQPGRPAGLRGRSAVLARPRHRRLPDRRRAGALQGAGLPRGARAGGADAVRRLAHRSPAARAARPLPAAGARSPTSTRASACTSPRS